METTANTTQTSAQRPATDKQLAYIDSLLREAIQNDDDNYEYSERLAIALGHVDGDGNADEAAARREWEQGARERISSREAGASIEVLKAMAAESRCQGYCRQRGVQHSTVHYYDGHYDYECGLS